MKTLELGNYGLRELELLECQSTDGGMVFLLGAFALAYMGIGMTAIMSDPKGVFNGFMDALN